MSNRERLTKLIGSLAGLAIVALLAGSAVPSEARPVAAPSATGLEAAAVPGTPTVPVSVTRSRAFVVTGEFSAAHSGALVLSCYRRVSGRVGARAHGRRERHRVGWRQPLLGER